MQYNFPVIADSFPRIFPAFPALVKLLSQCAESGVKLGCAGNEFQSCSESLAIGYQKFSRALLLMELPADPTGAVGHILHLFTMLGMAMGSLAHDIADNNPESAAIDCNVIARMLMELDAHNQVLRKAAQTAVVYSDVPVINGLYTAGMNIIEGRGTWDSLSAKLEEIVPSWNAMLDTPEVPEEMVRHDQALDALVRIVNEQDLDSLKDALDEVKESGEALVGLRERLDRQERGVGELLCPRCGRSVDKGMRLCPGCGMRMPETFSEQPEGSMSSSMPDYVKNLCDAAENLMADESFLDAYRIKLLELQRRIANCRKSLEAMEQVSVDENVTDPSAVEMACEAVRSALEMFDRAQEMLDVHYLPVDDYTIREGLDVLISAVEEMRRATALTGKALDVDQP